MSDMQGKIYEIAQMMSDNKALQSDLQEAASSALTLFRDKYINKIYDTVREHHVSATQSPSREVTLINALKPYIAKESHVQLDKMINVITLMNTMQVMNGELASYAGTNNRGVINNRGFRSMSSSLHDDGVYDIDTNCSSDNIKSNGSIQFTSVLLMMALMGNLHNS